jgi:hypothetical protein
MTIRDDVRKHFEHEAIRHPAPLGLRAAAVTEARGQAIEPRPRWIAGAVAILLAVAIVAGLLAASALRHTTVTPVPGNGPKLLFHDKLGAAATGRPSLPRPTGSSVIHRYRLAAPLPPTPTTGTVYAVDPSLAPAPKAIALALGITNPPQQISSGEFDVDGLQYFPGTGTVRYSTTGNAPVASGQPFTDKASAISSAGDVLVSLGLFSRTELASMPASANRFIYNDAPPMWSIQFVRTLDGVPQDEFWAGSGASLQMQESGAVQLLYVSRAPISGSQPTSLIDAASAWRQVTLGHAYALGGLENNGAVDVALFRADKVELCYLDTAGPWVIPMWCFRDVTSVGATYPLWVFYPAMTPGTFDSTTPNS